MSRPRRTRATADRGASARNCPLPRRPLRRRAGPGGARARVLGGWEGRQRVPLLDAFTAVRRWLWTHWVFPRAGHAEAFAKVPEAFRRFLLYALAPVA